MSTKYSLQIIDGWTLRYGGTIIEIKSTKARALISLLSLDRAGVRSRSEICRMLWPESEQKKSRASLRRCVAIVRNALNPFEPDFIHTTGDRISLDRSNLTIDLELLLNQLESEHPRAVDIALCEAVPSMMQDFDFGNDDLIFWIQWVRDKSIKRVSGALKSHYEDSNVTHELREACATLAIKLDPFDEQALRALMTLHVQCHSPVNALRLYGEFYERIEQEMDAEPSAATKDLAISIKLNQVSIQSPTTISPTSPKPTACATLTIAVMPFELIGLNPNERHISIGILDLLTSHLASYKAPSVISSNSTRGYLNKTQRPSVVGRELNVRYVLIGSVRFENANAALAVQLVEVTTERIIWASTKYCTRKEVMQVQTPIAEEIARAILPSVDAEELRVSRKIRTEDLEPYHLILQAKERIFKLEYNEFITAGKLLRRAIEIGPHFSPAYSLLADWHSIKLWEGWSKDPAVDQIKLDQNARKAIALTPDDGRVMALWAHNRMMFNREYDSALSTISQAVDLCPNDSETLAWSVPTLANTRNTEEAIRNGLKSIALSPFDPFVFRNEHFLGIALFVQGDYERSAQYGMSCFRQSPNYRSNLRCTIAALNASSQENEAIKLVEHHNEITPGFSVSEFKKIHGMRDPKDRDAFAAHLLAAGLPA